MPKMITTRLLHTEYYLTIRRARNSWVAKGNSTSKLHYIKPFIKEWESAYNSCRQYRVKLSKIHIGHTRITHGHLMSRNEQPPTCKNAACGNQRLTIKHCLQYCPQYRDSRKKSNIQGDIMTLLGKNCEVKKVMKLLREMGMFEEI